MAPRSKPHDCAFLYSHTKKQGVPLGAKYAFAYVGMSDVREKR